MTIHRDRRDQRDVYRVAREDYKHNDLSGLDLVQVKLVLRMAKQKDRRALAYRGADHRAQRPERQRQDRGRAPAGDAPLETLADRHRVLRRPPIDRNAARLERLDTMDSTLFGRDLWSFGRLLLDRGWIAAIGYFSRIDVEVMDDIFEEVEVTVDEAAGLYTYPHPFRRKVILSGSLAEVTRYRFQREPFFDHLATLLGIEPRFAGRRRCLVEHHLWYLGDVRVGNRHIFAPIFFGRRLKDAPAEQITSALSDPAFGSGGVVLALKIPRLLCPTATRCVP